MLTLLPPLLTAMTVTPATSAVAAASASSQRLALREELLSLLPTGAPFTIDGRAQELVEEIELLESIPATSAFLTFGLNGAWALRGSKLPEEHIAAAAAAQPLKAPASELVEILDVTQELDTVSLESRSAVRFRCDDGALEGKLLLMAEVNANADLVGGREDTIQLLSGDRKLELARQPSSCSIVELMGALHSQLPYDFLGDAGVRLSMQTTYLDETLRITRCTTRALATACSVHVRAD